MDFNLSEEQTAIQDSLKRYLAKDYSFEQRRALVKGPVGHSEQAWATYAELGLLALPFPEAAGGLGGNAIDTMLIAETLGTSLALEPFLSSVVLAGSSQPLTEAFAARDAGISGAYFNVRKTTIYGGSTEVQKNIISQMILGL